MTGLQYGFGQVDYTRSEPDGVMVEVIKRQENVGDFVLTVTPLSYSQFDSMGITLPPELPIGSRPDEAECEHAAVVSAHWLIHEGAIVHGPTMDYWCLRS